MAARSVCSRYPCWCSRLPDMETPTLMTNQGTCPGTNCPYCRCTCDSRGHSWSMSPEGFDIRRVEHNTGHKPKEVCSCPRGRPFLHFEGCPIYPAPTSPEVREEKPGFYPDTKTCCTKCLEPCDPECCDCGYCKKQGDCECHDKTKEEHKGEEKQRWGHTLMGVQVPGGMKLKDTWGNRPDVFVPFPAIWSLGEYPGFRFRSLRELWNKVNEIIKVLNALIEKIK